MSPRHGRTWSYAVGDHGARVRVYERAPGGLLYLAAWDPTLREGRGGVRRRSLGHRDRTTARKEARQLATQLEQGTANVLRPTLGYVLDLYRHHQLPTLRPKTAKWVRQHLGAWEAYLGRTFSIRELSLREWEGFQRLRATGAIDAGGHPVDPAARRPVSPGTVNLGLDALSLALNWAVRWRVQGRPVLDRSPVWRLPYAKDVNPRRALWTHERYEQLLAAAEEQMMEVEWEGRRARRRSHLADVLVVAHGTGRRIGAVRQLRYEDLRLSDRSPAAPYGRIAWPAGTDKAGKAWSTPITADVRDRLLQVLRERPGFGPMPIFPGPRHPQEPVQEETLRRWLGAAEAAAGLEHLPHAGFHALRRKWVTERKHLPDADVARAGGWRSVGTMKRAYQQADDVGVLEAVLEPRRLREAGA